VIQGNNSMKTKISIVLILTFISLLAGAQNKLEWSADYRLKASDFQGKAPDSPQLESASGSFSVTYEFGGINLITTRNLNKYVSALFQRNASYIAQADEATTQRLLKYQQLIFNLYELQARRLRQKFFENRRILLTKGASVLHQEVAAEHAELLEKIQDETFYGSSSEEIARWNQWVLQELDQLSDFSKTGTPSKKKNRKK